MHRQSDLESKQPQCASPEFTESGLTKPEDIQLFYTASVHFLRKKLLEKSRRTPMLSNAGTQSCSKPETISRASTGASSRFFKSSNLILCRKASRTIIVVTPPSSPPSSLSMNQVLPFPKYGSSFFSRLLKWGSNRQFELDDRVELKNGDKNESSKISNFKFPRCERTTRLSKSLYTPSSNNSKETCKNVKPAVSVNFNEKQTSWT